MLAACLFLGVLPLAIAAPAESASAFVGSTVTATFPLPDATFTLNENFFPDAEQVGFPGPTPSKSQSP